MKNIRYKVFPWPLRTADFDKTLKSVEAFANKSGVIDVVSIINTTFGIVVWYKTVKYEEEPVVEREHISGILNYCFKNVQPTEEYFLHQCEKRKIEGLVPTRPYYVPIRFLSCLKEGGAGISFEIERCLATIRYGKNKEKTAYKHLYGVCKAELNGEEVLAAMIGGCKEPSFKDPPNVSDPKEVMEIRKIFREINKHTPVEDINYFLS
jgi:hypothetical protein